MTEESYPDGLIETGKDNAKDLENYERLMEKTKQKLKIIECIIIDLSLQYICSF